jgi:hypothetical protein
MDGLDSFELTPIHLSHQIDLRGKLGLVFIRRTDDGKTILARTSNYAAIDRPTPATIVNIDAALGLVLDIGIKREKQLTLGGGLYAPHDLEPPQSDRLVTQGDFDEALFDTITSSLNAQYQSGDLSREVSSIKANYLIEAYNSARLLYPRFHNESYLGLMRIIDGISQARRALEFALAAATVSPDLNTEISQKVSEVAGLAPRIQLAQEVFEEQLRSARGDMSLKMRSLEEHGRFIFACFYSAYRYRNKFVHSWLSLPLHRQGKLGPNLWNGLPEFSARHSSNAPPCSDRNGLRSRLHRHS